MQKIWRVGVSRQGAQSGVWTPDLLFCKLSDADCCFIAFPVQNWKITYFFRNIAKQAIIKHNQDWDSKVRKLYFIVDSRGVLRCSKNHIKIFHSNVNDHNLSASNRAGTYFAANSFCFVVSNILLLSCFLYIKMFNWAYTALCCLDLCVPRGLCEPIICTRNSKHSETCRHKTPSSPHLQVPQGSFKGLQLRRFSFIVSCIPYSWLLRRCKHCIVPRFLFI